MKKKSLPIQEHLRAFARSMRSQRGQATSESAVLLVTTLLALTAGGTYLVKSHSDWLNALSSHVHGFYYLLSLPFP